MQSLLNGSTPIRLLMFLAAAWLPLASATAGAQTNFGSVDVGSSAAATVTYPIALAVAKDNGAAQEGRQGR